MPEELAQARLAARRQVKRNLMLERIVLANNTAVAGENALVVQTRWRSQLSFNLGAGKFTNPYTEASIDRRVADDFNGWEHVSPPTDRVNARGPYRYIEAADDDVRCVLAWQMIDAVAALTNSSIHTYAVDSRFCDTRRGVETLLALFDRLQLQPYL